MLEILDQSTARKTRHQTQGYKQPRMTNAKEEPRYAGTASKAGQAKRPGGKQTIKESTKKTRNREGRERGGTNAQHRPKAR